LKILSFVVCVICGALLICGALSFPDWADPHAPDQLWVADRYIKKSLEETHVPNIVTAVLADYRGYDTMYETTVIFCAGTAVLMILRRRPRK
jgi:multicomponent Na+:H+ antiporter subunit B